MSADYHARFACNDPPATRALQNRIIEAYEVSHYGSGNKERYLPAGHLDDLMTFQAVQEALSSGREFDLLPLEEQKRLIEFIIGNDTHVGKAKKLLAISILSNLWGDDLYLAMGKFQYQKFEDNHLPVSDPPRYPVFDGHPWGKKQASTDNFCIHQWKFLVPTFGGEGIIYRLDQKTILPFKGVGTSPRDGTFGKVFQVEIHEAHLDRKVFKAGFFLFVNLGWAAS